MNKMKIAGWIMKGVFAALLILILSFSIAFAVYTKSIQRQYEAKKAEFMRTGIAVHFADKSIRVSPIDVVTFNDRVQESLTIPSLEKKSATLQRIKGQFKIEPEIIGYRLDREALMNDLQGRIRTFSPAPIIVKLTNESPEILQSDFQLHLPVIQKKLNTPILATSKDFNFTLRLRDHMDFIEFRKSADKGVDMEIKLVKDLFSQFVTREWSRIIDQPAVPVKISKKDDKRLHFEGKGKNGRTVNVEELRSIMNIALLSDITKIELPIDEKPFDVVTSPEVAAMGIKEVLSIGHTTYYSSPANRMYNIGVGMKKFDGVIIPQGGIFSFNENLGKVDGSSGFLKELVIKPEGTIPEFGGGLCQVSTTAYRAALYAGLTVTERTPHSYAVGYYSQVGGHGIDATIYPGSRDLKFKNDTPGAISMQAYSEGPEAYFILYGINDGRTVTMEGPTITNRHSDGSTETTKTTTLPVGTTQQIEKAHQGFDTIWYRYVTLPGGLATKEEITSKYRATKNRFLVGATAEEIVAQPTNKSAPGFKD